MSWLTAHNPIIGWSNRSIEIRTPGRAPRLIKPIECIDDAPGVKRLATITTKGLHKEYRRGNVQELYACLIRPVDTSTPAVPTEDPAAEELLS